MNVEGGEGDATRKADVDAHKNGGCHGGKESYDRKDVGQEEEEEEMARKWKRPPVQEPDAVKGLRWRGGEGVWRFLRRMVEAGV